jgi:hypothetical protein
VIEPGRKRDSAPFESVEVRKRVLKDLRRQVFGFLAVADTSSDERLDTLKIALV